MITKPMLAGKIDSLDNLSWPMVATPKVDGIRCLNPDGRILSRKFKPIPNKYIRSVLEKILPVGSDGEIMSSDSFQGCTSNVMSFEGEPEFIYCMFDFVPDGNLNTPYIKRLEKAERWLSLSSPEVGKIVKLLPYTIVDSKEEFEEYHKQNLDKGYEGSILRTLDGPYKCGRSTAREAYLLKWKPFADSECKVIGFVEGLHNVNTLGKDELGYAKRSAAKSGKIPANTLGKFLVVDIHSGVEFKCGTGKGLTQELRKEIWENQDKYLGRIFKYKYQECGVKDKPRLPIWLGWRDPIDM